VIRVKHFQPNTTGRDFVVGDIHGCYHLLLAEMSKVKFDKKQDRLFSVGDLIDRGPDSLQCLLLINEPWFFANRGNHEDMLIESFSHSYCLQRVGKHVWLSNGGDWSNDCAQQLADNNVNIDQFLDNVLNMPLVTVVHKQNGQRINIVHAEFIDAPVTDEMIDNEDLGPLSQLLWARRRGRHAMKGESPDPFLHDKYLRLDEGLSRTYVGHSPVYIPKVLGKYHFIDTGAVFGGELTMVQL
jgi:serine/threonine protein phosphatase 1